MTIETTLSQRERTHGSFLYTAETAQKFKELIRYEINVSRHYFTAYQTEALEMIATKIARILNGDPNHVDSWIDIAGYATLAAESILKKEQRDGGAK